MQCLKSFLLAAVTLVATSLSVAAEPSPPTYTGVDHVVLKVTDPERSLKFYSRLFGGDALAPKQGTTRHLSLVGSHLSFVADKAAQVEHFCFGQRQFSSAEMQGWFKREGLAVQVFSDGALQVADRDNTKVLVAGDKGWESLKQQASNELRKGPADALFHPLLIDEVYITVTNLEVDSLHYARVLGKSGGLQTGSLWFTVGSARLRLGQAPVGQKPGPNYFSVLVSNTDLQSAADAVFKAGGIIENILPNGFSFWDPDGIRVEIHVAGQF